MKRKRRSVPRGYSPTLETKERECWKLRDSRLNSEFDSRVHGQPYFSFSEFNLLIHWVSSVGNVVFFGPRRTVLFLFLYPPSRVQRWVKVRAWCFQWLSASYVLSGSYLHSQSYFLLINHLSFTGGRGLELELRDETFLSDSWSRPRLLTTAERISASK